MKEKETFEKTEDVASATECTGILPAMPADDMPEAEKHAAELYAIHKPQKQRKPKQKQ